MRLPQTRSHPSSLYIRSVDLRLSLAPPVLHLTRYTPLPQHTLPFYHTVLAEHPLVCRLLFFQRRFFTLSETLELARDCFIVLCYRKRFNKHFLRFFVLLESDLSEALSIQRFCYKSP